MVSFVSTDISPIEVILDFISGGRHIVCRNPSFGLATKAKGLQGAGLIVDPGVQLCERKTLSVNEDIDLFF
jgi:hypothetical protein